MDDIEIKTILMGNLPDWILVPYRKKFIVDREALLSLHNLSDDDLAAQIGEVLEVHAGNMADPDYVIHEEKCRSVIDGKPVDEIMARRERMIRVMARVIRAVELGPERGLALLTDPDHAEKAIHGEKMEKGRKIGTGGPIRKAVAKLLLKNPTLKNPALWTALFIKPPRGWKLFDNSTGKYIEGPSMANMNYERFCNVCGEERKKIRTKNTG